MREQTRRKVRDILTSFVSDQLPKLTKWSLDDIRRGYPFHRIIFPDQAILAARVERSVVTSMGTTLYPQLAKAVAGDNFADVQTEYPIEGSVNDAACNMIRTDSH